MNEKTIVDMFCGAGGESTGITQACEEQGFKYNLFAINHWERAIETHSLNHPSAQHYCESIQNLDPTQVIKKGRVSLLWASPECTHHSNARGGRPRSNQSRASAWLLLKWLSDLYVERVIIENVPEFLNWGPLGINGQLLKSKKGDTFRAFIAALQSLGYRVDWRILCAADYGDPTTRRRLFVQAVRGHKQIIWPEPSHSESASLFTLENWIPAKEIIDWSIPGKSIFTRKKPLSENTMKRIEAGIQKFWGDFADPFLIRLRGTTDSHLKTSAIDINNPLPTVTTAGNHFGLIQPFLTKFHGGNPNRNYSVEEPIGTLDCSNRYGLVPFIMASGHRSSIRNRPVSLPLSTVVTKAEHYLIKPFIIQYYGNGEARSIGNPLDTVTCRDRFALIAGQPYSLDIRFRMLEPHELGAAQGFPAEYVFTGNKNDKVKQIGNAVPVNTAKALYSAILKGDAA